MKIHGEEKIAFILQELGERVKDIRIRRYMTQKDLAENAGVSFSTVVRIERGESVNLDNLMRVMRVFDLLGNFDLLIPEQVLTPEEIFKGKSKKKRAHKISKLNDSQWVWEDEKE